MLLICLLGQARVVAVDAAAPRPEARRAEYARYAIDHDGDSSRGKSIFESETKANCVKCHTVDGSRKGPGPDLQSIGDKFERAELIKSVLEPSAEIAIGYSNILVLTETGLTITGVIQRVTDDWMELVDQNAQTIRVPRDEIEEAFESETSVMPDALEANMTRQEFADLISYLASLRQKVDEQSATLAHGDVPQAVRPAQFVPYFDDAIHFEHPLWVGAIPGYDQMYVVLEHFGGSWIVRRQPGTDSQSEFLDLRDVIRPGGATGLLGMAFHPHFIQNHKYYLKYQIVDSGQIFTIVEERQFAQDSAADSGRSPRELLRIAGDTQDHNGGCLEFGPDGLLYVGMGDTGPQRDPRGHGQDLGSLLGKILRIDVDHHDVDHPYAIPTGNPFRSVEGARPEIWAYGFREPWRFTFDPLTHDLWVGDVGQDQYEEVTIAKIGENHGWNVYEGFAPFSEQYRKFNATYVPPLFSYPRRLGVSITGGYVYRGAAAPEMQGWYICGDFESRRVWALRQEDRKLVDAVEIGRSPSRISSFGQDSRGEILLVGYDSGVIYGLPLADIDPRPRQSRVLLATAESTPATWRFTYDEPTSSWSDTGFDDSRWNLGPGGFGSMGTPGAVVRTDWRSQDIWLRRAFELPENTGTRDNLVLRVHHDEDAEIFINGVIVQRLPRWTNGYQDFPLNAQEAAALRSGQNILAIHCHQNSGGQYIDAGIVEYLVP